MRTRTAVYERGCKGFESKNFGEGKLPENINRELPLGKIIHNNRKKIVKKNSSETFWRKTQKKIFKKNFRGPLVHFE